MELLSENNFTLFDSNSSFLSTVSIFDNSNVRFFLISLYTLVWILCFFGNLLVLVVIGLHYRMRSITNYCLANLAFTDFCVAIFCVFQNLSIYLVKDWILGNILCKMYNFIDRLSYTASVLILVLISLERYLAILHHSTWKKALHHRNLWIIICILWLVSALINAPRLYYHHTIKHVFYDEDGAKVEEIICLPDLKILDTTYYDLAIFLILYLLPMIIISLAYARIGVYFYKSTSFLKTSPRPLVHQKPAQQNSSNSNNPPPNIQINQSVDGRLNVAPNNSSSGNSHSDLSVSGAVYKPISPNEPIVCINVTKKSGQFKKSGGFSKKKKLNTLMKSRGTEYDIVYVANKDGENENDQNPQVTPQQVVPNGLQTPHSLSSEGVRKLRVTRKKPLQKESVHSQKRVIAMLVAIVTVFAICNFPFHFRKVLQHWAPGALPNKKSPFYPLLTIATNILMYAQSGINPIIYVFFSKRFQESFKELFGNKIMAFFRPRDKATAGEIGGPNGRGLLPNNGKVTRNILRRKMFRNPPAQSRFN